MHTPEKHRLTSRERKIVVAVTVFMLILFAVWIFMMINQLGEPSHGIM